MQRQCAKRRAVSNERARASFAPVVNWARDAWKRSTRELIKLFRERWIDVITCARGGADVMVSRGLFSSGPYVAVSVSVDTI